MRRSVHIASCLVLALAACEDGFAPGFADIVMLPDAVSDLPLLPDAVLIGEEGFRPDAITGDPGTTDAGATLDPGLPSSDAMAPEDASMPDPGEADVPGDPDVLEPDALLPCGDDGTVCEPGMTCLFDEEGGGRCVPVGKCSDEGTVDLLDLAQQLLVGEDLFVKVAAPVWVGPPSCSLVECPKDDPCCNACFAQLFIGDETLPIVLLGSDVTFGCRGSSCDFAQSCRPLVPGNRYRVWGHVHLFGPRAEFQVEGFCLFEEGDSA
jgi:hypothetical protein